MSFPLRFRTPASWTAAVMADFDRFLLDHAAAEKKAAGMAVSMLSHYPDRTELVTAMADLAVEEMSHFREVVKILHSRGLQLARDEKDAYVLAMRAAVRNGSDDYFLDRLLVGGIIEARGAERFGLVAEALADAPLKRFYQSITRSEERHYALFVDLARRYFPEPVWRARLDELIDIEADVASRQADRPALH
ncbi:MAG TPA: tRNA-(ms[2]io[6]A)-hydroxylase [Spongiibacteraceae bacterium]|jgi:tRNA-(ms[2]io[6]A)-hydroxylase|nr:tRNA-(ms[2]io[6]A)-hydroxylase [Spongiibacteraceae bacterium]HUH37681.1 tRNA-(ms[2]io[6]A)-hydroxylase [Spongiibacteraceae bacterium]